MLRLLRRLIVHNDKYNPLLTMIEEYQKQLAQFQPKLFVLGGLQMMDNFPYETGLLHYPLNTTNSAIQL